MVLIVDYLSTSQRTMSAPSTTISKPLSLSSPQTWLKKWLQRKIVQNADCDDEADFAFCIFCDDEADMQIGLKAQRGKMWGGARWSGQRGLLTRAENFWPAHTSTHLYTIISHDSSKECEDKM